jgi:ligand-binding sensor domain-containing protein
MGNLPSQPSLFWENHRITGSQCASLWGQILLVAVALTFFVTAAPAAENAGKAPSYFVYTYGVDEGLPHNSTPVVLQTRNGYIWTGTESGLCRFDGVRFVSYRVASTAGLSDNLIRQLYEDDSGTLWIGTQRGLCSYRDGKFKIVGLQGLQIRDIVKDRAGSIWIATMQGLWEYRGGEFISHANDPVLPETDTTRLFLDSHDRLWLGSTTKAWLIWRTALSIP